jgi:thymidylate synthase (FAD)
MQLINPSYEILTEIDADKILKKLELAGRTCWLSHPKEDSAEKFCRMILNKNHESVIEHESLTIKFIVSRSFLAEITRHRLSSFSVESTRYLNYNKRGMTFIIPTWINFEPGEYDVYHCGPKFDIHTTYKYGPYLETVELDDEQKRFIDYLKTVETLYSDYIKDKKSPQEARAILPNCLKTEIIMTTNLREIRHILKLRTDKSAHPEMRQIMCPLLEELKGKIPVIFDGINENDSL